MSVSEALQIGVSSIHVGDIGEPQLFGQPVLQRSVRTLDAAFGLGRIGAQNLDVPLARCPAKLGGLRAAFGVFPGHTKHGVLVGIERDGTTVHLQAAFQSLK